MRATISKCAGALCAGALCVSLISGCAPTTATNTLTEEQQANRDYMAQVNRAMESLGSSLEKFADSVARKDLVSMRVQAEDAFKSLDQLSATEAPEALADIRESYVSGTSELRQALSAYIDLYAEIEAAGDSFDWSSYDQRVAQIQEHYNAGIAALESGDTMAASKE